MHILTYGLCREGQGERGEKLFRRGAPPTPRKQHDYFAAFVSVQLPAPTPPRLALPPSSPRRRCVAGDRRSLREAHGALQSRGELSPRPTPASLPIMHVRVTFGDRGPLGSPRLCPRSWQGEDGRPGGRPGSSTRCRGVSRREPAPSSTGRGTRRPLGRAALRSPGGGCLTARRQVRGHGDGRARLDVRDGSSRLCVVS